jgi:hypothetical protein
LIERELAERLPRQPGQKEQRYRHLLEDETAVERAPAPAPAAEEPVREPEPDRLGALERDLRELRDEVAALRAELASERGRPLQEEIAAVPRGGERENGEHEA